ncbi:hypothetical protein [Chromobacterium phragmitis]|nr:hypothetical protein [Chromobacterium phragmitis]
MHRQFSATGQGAGRRQPTALDGIGDLLGDLQMQGQGAASRHIQ